MSDDALAQSRRSWRSAEARLYPLAMTNVDGYQRALVLVAAVCERLRTDAATPEDLLRRQADAAEYVASACDATGTTSQGLDVDDLFGSAAAARDRELAGEGRRQARLAAIENARSTGSEWTDLHAEALGTHIPELLLHIETGWAILTEMGADENTGAPVLMVTTVRVDPTTGELHAHPENEVHVVSTADEWSSVARALQADRR